MGTGIMPLPQTNFLERILVVRQISRGGTGHWTHVDAFRMPTRKSLKVCGDRYSAREDSGYMQSGQHLDNRGTIRDAGWAVLYCADAAA